MKTIEEEEQLLDEEAMMGSPSSEASSPSLTYWFCRMLPFAIVAQLGTFGVLYFMESSSNQRLKNPRLQGLNNVGNKPSKMYWKTSAHVSQFLSQEARDAQEALRARELMTITPSSGSPSSGSPSSGGPSSITPSSGAPSTPGPTMRRRRRLHMAAQDHMAIADHRLQHNRFATRYLNTKKNKTSRSKMDSPLSTLFSPRPEGDEKEEDNKTAKKTQEKTVVVYTGPSHLDAEQGKTWLYIQNFEYFLDHGIDCRAELDYVLVLTAPVAQHYQAKIQEIAKSCARFGTNTLRVLEREDKCYDMESMRLVMEKVDLKPYDYFVYLNCGVVGPKLPAVEEADAPQEVVPAWPERYTNLLSDQVKMSGVTINCRFHPHVQTMLFAVDRVGLDILAQSGAIYDCQSGNENLQSMHSKMEIVLNYEVAMGKAIMEAGYGIRSTHGSMGTPVEVHAKDIGKLVKGGTSQDLSWCKDIWYPNRLPFLEKKVEEEKPEIMPWEDYMFFKSSRMFLLPDIQQEVKYSHPERFTVLGEAYKDSLLLQWDQTEIKMRKLWIGKATTPGRKPKDLSISIVVSHCRKSLSWMEDYLKGFDITSITIVSKCGQPPSSQEIPAGASIVELPNVGRIDHTIAHSIAQIAAKKPVRENEIVVFLKDNLLIHQNARPRPFAEIVRIASSEGFACYQEPSRGMSQFHKTKILTGFTMTSYDGIKNPLAAKNGVTVKDDINSNHEFKNGYSNMGAWLEDLQITLPTPLTAVCYGGIFATTTTRIASVPETTWQALEKSLSRGDNIEEGHFAERTWAGLLSEPQSTETSSHLLARATHINFKVAIDGGGHLGALML